MSSLRLGPGNYPTETDRWDKSELRITERLSLPVFFFFFVVIHSTSKHALRKESTIKRSVDDLELLDDQRRKSARIVI